MARFHHLTFWCFLLIIDGAVAISYNQPKFCPNASWNATALTFATNTIVGSTPNGIFVNSNNTVYIANRESSRVHVWLEGSTTSIRNLSSGLNLPYSVFATDNGDIFVDNGQTNNRVDRWQTNSTDSIPALYTCGTCYDLFIDTNNNLYCSMYDNHQVSSNSLTNRLNLWSIVAGTAACGSTTTTVCYPRGIFVDINLNLYLADSGNHRIQLYAYGQLTGTAVAGASAAGTITLNSPTDVALDADGYLFILDSENFRVVGSGPYGFRCVLGCSGSGSSSSQLDSPSSFSFDTYGNIFITDRDNNRVQKFLISTNVCNGTSTTTTTATVTASSSIIPTSASSVPSSYSNGNLIV
ncbi:hypothetical protein I4U23_013323 [Adineta vaga]|nr:hypothetical protein I4U23_013323 [Adineta vaga]